MCDLGLRLVTSVSACISSELRCLSFDLIIECELFVSFVKDRFFLNGSAFSDLVFFGI